MCYITNLDSLCRFHNQLGGYYSQHDIEGLTDHVECSMTKDGMPVLRVFDNGKKIFMGSAYYHNKEVERYITDNQDINDYSVLLIYGFGTGNIIRNLLSIFPKHIRLIVYEPSLELFSYVMGNIDISDVLCDERLCVFVEGINSDSLDAFLWDNIDESNYKISRIIELPAYSKVFEKQYRSVTNIYNTHIEHCAADVNSGIFHSRKEVENDIYNLEFVYKGCCLDQLIGKLPIEYPAVIISAGPSLEKNGKVLKNLKGKLFLVAVDTALPYLLSIDVVPDLAVTVSPNKDEVLTELYNDPRLKKIPFAIDTSVTYTGICKVVGENVIYASTSSPYYKQLFQMYNHVMDKLKSGGSVSTIAFSLLYELGYRSFIFVGLDLSLRKDKLYAGTISDDNVMNKDMIAIEGYYGDEVYTFYTYKMHLDWFESIAKSYQDIKMYNATEGGAMIHGMENCTLQEMADQYDCVSCDYEKIIYNTKPAVPQENDKELYYYYLHSVDNLDKMYRLLDTACERMDAIFHELSRGMTRESIVIKKYNSEIDTLISICRELPESFYLERIVGDRHGDILEDIYVSSDNPEKEYRRILEKLYSYFDDMKNSVQQVKELYLTMIDRIENRLNDLGKDNVDSDIIYNNNKKMLEDKYGDKISKLIKIQGDGMSPKIELSKKGLPITLVELNGKTIYLNSKYDPEAEASKFVSQYADIADYSICMYFGFGNGIIARELIADLAENVSLVFYEPYPEIFVHTLHEYDISDIIDNPRVHIFVNGMNDNELDIFLADIITEANYRYTFYDAIPKYKMMNQNEFERTLDRFNEAVQGVRNNIETIKYQSGIEAKNNIMNLKYLVNCCCEEQFRDIFPTDLPVILVAAGPSLKNNISELKKLKGKLLIIAVDTVAKYLVNNGVRPDIVVTVDPFITSRIFDGISDEKLICAYNSGVGHDTLEGIGGGRKIVISSRSAYYDKLLELSGYHMYQLNGGGSVSTIAFALAQSWGYNKYILVGQDLAFQGEQRYADGNLGIEDDRKEYELVEGYYGDLVKSPMDLKIYLDWYEMMVRSHPEFTIINATEGGARIKGTLKKTLSDIVSEYGNCEYDYETIINEHELLFDEDKYVEVKKYVSNSVTKLTDMKEQLGKGIYLINETLEKLGVNGMSGINIRKVHDEINTLIGNCADMDEGYFVDGIIADKQADVLADIYEQISDPVEEYRRILQKLHSYVSDMYDAVDEVIETFDDALKEM